MQKNFILFLSSIILCGQISSAMAHGLHAEEFVESDKQSDYTFVDTDGSETFFVSSEDEDTAADNAELEPEKYIIDTDGIEKLHPFSNDKYPYSVMAKVDRMRNIGGLPTFDLSGFESPYTDRMNTMSEYLQSGSYVGDSENWILLKSDRKTIAKSAAEVAYVIIKDTVKYMPDYIQIRTLPGEKGRWWECKDKNYVGNYVGHGCYTTGRSMSKHFKKFLDANLLSCVNESLAKIGKRAVKRVGVRHVGITGDTRHRRAGGSYHNIDRAIDIKEFHFPGTRTATMTFEKAVIRHNVVNKKSVEGRFYIKFRTCYQQRQMKRSSACRDNKKPNGYVGSIGWEHPGHLHHIHISYPFCSGKNEKKYYEL